MIASTMLALAAMAGAGDLVVEEWDPTTSSVYVKPAWSPSSDWVVGNDGVGVLGLYEASDPQDPNFVSAIPFGDPFWAAVWGDTCYVSTGLHTLQVFIFELNPELGFVPLGTLGQPGLHLGVEGGLLYVEFGDVFYIYDRRAPGGPVLLSSTPLDVFEFVWDETRVYAESGDSITILDVSDPFEPYVAGSIDRSPASIRYMAIERDRDLLAIDTRVDHHGPYYLELWDVSLPSAPVLLSAIDVEYPRQLAIRDTLLVHAGYPTQLLSISDPTEPRLLAEIEGRGSPSLLDDVTHWASGGSRGVTGYDIATPSAPESLWTRDRIGIIQGSALSDTLVITLHDHVPPDQDPHLKIHGLSDLRRHQTISRVDFPHYRGDTGMVACAGGVAYVAPELWCVDLADPAHPVVTDSLTPGGDSIFTDLVATLPGGLVAVASDFDIHTFSTDDPLHPTPAGFLDMGSGGLYWALETTYLHDRWEALLGSEAGFFRIDLSDLDAPVIISRLATPPSSIAVDDTLAYLGYRGMLEVWALERDGGSVLLERIFPEDDPWTHGLLARGERLYASHRTESEHYLTAYSWSPSTGFRVEDRVPVAGYTSRCSPIGLPEQRILPPATGGLHRIWDRGALRHPPLLAPRPEVRKR